MGIKVTCNDCGTEIEVSESWYNAVKRKNRKFRCKTCTKLWRKQAMKNRMDTMSEEDKKNMYGKIVEKNKINYSKMSKEDIAKRMSNLQKASAEWRKNVTPEEKERISKIHTESNNRVWEEYRNNPEKYAAYLEKLNDRWDNKSDEEKKQHSDTIKARWSNYSDEELNIVKNNMKDGAIQRWENMDSDTKAELSNKISGTMKSNWENDEYRDKQLNAIRDGYVQWWDNLPDKEEHYKPIIDNLHPVQKELWNNLPITSKEMFTKKRLISSIGKNRVHLYFESRFNEINNRYYILTPEYPATNRGVMHSWDYAVYYNNDLICLIDIDGKYFHADECDYDGMHSHEEYDEKRGLSIPTGVKCCIIYENEFDKSFEYLRKILSLTYDEYVEQKLREYRSMPFPYPHYTDTELLRSYNDITKMDCDDKYHQDMSMNTRVGDRLIFHFHQSLFDPLIESWNDDDVLRGMIKRGYLYHSYLNRNKILQGFNIYEPCKRTQFISAGKAKMIVNKYLNEYDEVFCPSFNYSSIMLACIAIDKHYIGLFDDELQLIETNNMLGFLWDNKIDYNVTLIKNNTVTKSVYQCIFVEVNNDDQIAEYLFVYKCKRYLFLTEDTAKYVDNVVDITNDKFIIVIENGD